MRIRLITLSPSFVFVLFFFALSCNINNRIKNDNIKGMWVIKELEEADSIEELILSTNLLVFGDGDCSFPRQKGMPRACFCDWSYINKDSLVINNCNDVFNNSFKVELSKDDRKLILKSDQLLLKCEKMGL